MPTEEREDFDSEEEEGEGEATPAQPAPRRRPASAARRARNGVGAPAAHAGSSSSEEHRPREAEELWPYLLANVIPERGATPFDVRIQVYQLDPPVHPGRDMVLLGTISGANVAGNGGSASEQLLNLVTNNYHLTRAAGLRPVTYQLRFIWAQDSKRFAVGDLTLPGRDEILAVRRAEALQQAAQPPGAYVPPPMPPAAAPTGVAPAGVGQPPPGFAAPPPDSMPMAFQMMREMFLASQENRQPVMTPQMMMEMMKVGMGMVPPPAPAPPPVDEAKLAERVTANVLMALKQVGFFQQQQAPAAGVAAPQTAIVPTKSKMESAFDRVMEAAISQFIGGVERTVKQTMTGVGAPPPPEPEPEEPEEVEPPFTVSPVPEARWSNGTPINYAMDKDGNPDWKGILFSNPFVIEKGMEVGLGAVGAVTEAIKRAAGGATVGVGQLPPPAAPTSFAPPPAPASEVVSEIPSSAVAADGDEWKR